MINVNKEASPISINVTLPDDNDITITLSVDVNTMINTVNDLVHNLQFTHVLFFQNKQMENDRSLFDHGVQNGQNGERSEHSWMASAASLVTKSLDEE